METVTQWFDGDVKPAHVGYYQRKYGGGCPNNIGVKVPDFWDGENWFLGLSSQPPVVLAISRISWRGLAEKPKSA